MKKNLTFLTVLIVALCVFTGLNANAQGRIDLGRTAESGVVLQSSDFNGFNSTFSFNAIESDLISNEKGQFSELYIDGSFPNGNVGEPQLPMITRLIAIPDGATPVVTVGNYSETEYTLSDYGIGKVSAMQPPIRKNVNPDEVEYTVDEAAYARNSYNDAPIAMVEVLGTMRGLTLGRLIVQPVRYNPATGTIKVFNNVNVKVNFQNGDAASTAQMFKNTFSPAFNSVYDQIFNIDMLMGGTRDAYTDHPDMYNTPVKMLVICYSGFQGNAALNSWLQWKLQKGYYVDIFYTSETGTSASAIASFIKTKYNASVSSGNAYTYLVTIGDNAQIPAYTTEYEDSDVGYIPIDLGYASVNYSTNTNNYIPDMYYSRMSVENATHLTNYINKVLNYEKYQFSDGGNYLNNVILVGGWDSYWTPRVAQPTIEYGTNNYFKSNNTTYGGFGNGTIRATVSTSSTAGYSGSNNGCYQGVNNGVCFINYTAHGDKQEWSQPKLSAKNTESMTNTGKYFFGVGNCCLTGCFNLASSTYSSTNAPSSSIGATACLAETMIRVPNAGAVVYLGSSNYTIWMEDYYWAVGSGIHFNSSGSLQGTATTSNSTKGVYDAMFTDAYWNSASSLLFLGNLAVLSAENNANNYDIDVGAKYYYKFYHTFGDGSVMPFITKPEANNVTIPSTVAAGAGSMTVNAVAGSYVAVTNNTNTIYGVGVANNSGVATVNFTTAIPSTGTLYVVVTRQQYQPYFGTATITSGTASEYTINVSASPTNGGTVTGGGTFSSGTTRTVTATANTGYTFTNWTENGSVVSTNASYSFTLNYNRNLVANFAAQSFTVNAEANPAEGGSVALAQGGKGNRATLTYDFENGIGDWTILKGNTGNSSHNWMHNSEYPTSNNDFSSGYGHNDSDGFMLSESYISGTSSGSGSAVTPDNYLVSPQVTLGGSISFYAGARNTDYCAEKFSVMVSTTNNTNTNSFTTVATYTLSLSAAGYTSSPYTVDLSAYSGMGYIAIRHFDCNDQWFLCIDDVTIVEGEYVDPSTATGTFNYGQTCVATATPNTGYHFVNWTENNSVVSSNATYSFNVTANRNLVANFSQQQTQTYTVTLNSGTGGAITPSGTQTVNDGGSLTFTVNAFECYQIASVTVNGTAVTLNANNSYTITNIHGNQTVNVTYTYDNTCSDCNVYNEFSASACDSYTWNGQTYTQSGNYVQTFPIGGGGEDPGTCDENSPFNNSFEGNMGSWTTLDADGDGHTWSLASILMEGYIIPSYEGSDCVCSESYDGSSALTPDNYLISPKTMMTSAQHTISFWACAQDASWASEHFGVAVSTTNNTNANAFTTIQEWTMTAKDATRAGNNFKTRDGSRAQGAWYQYTVDLSAYIGQEIYVAIRHFNCSDMFYLDVDKIEFVCTGGGGGGGETDCTANTNFNNDFENGLGSWTTLDADGDSYTWFALNVTTDELDYNAAHAGEGWASSASYLSEALTPNNFLISPKTMMTAQQHTLTFWASAQDASWPSEHFGVAVSTTNNTSASAFTTIQEWDMTAKNLLPRAERPARGENNRDNGAWYQYTVDLSQYIGQEIYVAIRHFNCTDWFRLNIDDIELACSSKYEPTRDCDSIVTLHLTINPTYNQAVSVTITPDQLPYTWQGHTFNATGSYTAHLTSVAGCDSTVTMTVVVNDPGCETITHEFSATACDSYTWNDQTYTQSGDYIQTFPIGGGDDPDPCVANTNFNNDFENGLGNWTTLDADGDSYTWFALNVTTDGLDYNAAHAGEGWASSASYLSTALTPNNFLISPKTMMTAQQHTLTFWASAQDASWPSEHFGVAVSTTNNTSASAFTTIQEWDMTAKNLLPRAERPARGENNRDNGAWYQYTVDLSQYIGQEIYVAIRHFNCTDWFRLNVDDIELACSSKYEPTRDCDSIVTLHLTINETPTVTIDGTATIGTGEQTTLTASGAMTYVWSTGETTASITVSPSQTTTYTVTGISNGCSSTAQFTVTIDGIEENSSVVSVFPNPVDHVVNIKASNIERIRLFDITGQMLLDINESGDNATIDMNDFASGQYFLQVSTKTNVVTQKLVKK